MAEGRSAPATPAASRRLGRYEIIAEIARGGMGTVLLARLAGAGGFQRLFAVKLLHEHYAADRELVEMLLDEARIAAMIHHPNVVAIQEVHESEEHGYYLVMDYVEGFPLWDIWQNLNVAIPHRWRITNRIVLDALAGLGAAHELTDDDGKSLNVVHRDVSPQNILVGVDGIARVVDFGIAKAAARISSTRVGQVKGKLAYMAPEQARGRRVDARTDLFAAGTVLWETLTGQRLFRGGTDTETYHRLTAAPIPRARSVAPQVPVELDAVCAKALERDPDQRYPSARAMAQALEAAVRGSNLLADAHEVADWMKGRFVLELTARRNAIRAAVSTKSQPQGERVAELPGGLRVPMLPETSSSQGGQSPKGPVAESRSGVVDVEELDSVTTRPAKNERAPSVPGVVGKNTAPPRPTAGPQPSPMVAAPAPRVPSHDDTAPDGDDEDDATEVQLPPPELRAAAREMLNRARSANPSGTPAQIPSSAAPAAAARPPSQPSLARPGDALLPTDSQPTDPVVPRAAAKLLQDRARTSADGSGQHRPLQASASAIDPANRSYPSLPSQPVPASHPSVASHPSLPSVPMPAAPAPAFETAKPSMVDTAQLPAGRESQRWLIVVLVVLGLAASGVALTLALKLRGGDAPPRAATPSTAPPQSVPAAAPSVAQPAVPAPPPSPAPAQATVPAVVPAPPPAPAPAAGPVTPGGETAPIAPAPVAAPPAPSANTAEPVAPAPAPPTSPAAAPVAPIAPRNETRGASAQSGNAVAPPGGMTAPSPMNASSLTGAARPTNPTVPPTGGSRPARPGATTTSPATIQEQPPF